MSDYGEDDYSDYELDWFYVEEEYMPADDLAEHAVGSPPPTTYADEDAIPDWDRFDYFNDLEYASDGYDDANFLPHGSEAAKTGQKRKRGGVRTRGKKLRKLETGQAASRAGSPKSKLPPVVWRSQADRDSKPKVSHDNLESYALLKDWRERLADTPAWAAGSPKPETSKSRSRKGKAKAVHISELTSPAVDLEEEEVEAGEEEVDAGIDPAALMASLQKNLAAAGGPLSGMDPQQLLQFAMRMMSDQGAADDIAGELTEDLLNQGEGVDEGEEEYEEGEGEDPADLLSWLSKQRGAAHGKPTTSDAAQLTKADQQSEVSYRLNRPPTPPSSIRAPEDATDGDIPRAKHVPASKQTDATLAHSQHAPSRKRKAGDEVVNEGSTTVAKKRSTTSYDAPTASSQAKSTKVTRRGRTKPS